MVEEKANQFLKSIENHPMRGILEAVIRAILGDADAKTKLQGIIDAIDSGDTANTGP